MSDNKTQPSEFTRRFENTEAHAEKLGSSLNRIAKIVAAFNFTPVADGDAIIEKIKKDPQLAKKYEARQKRYEIYEDELAKKVPETAWDPLVYLGIKFVAKTVFLFQDKEPAAQQIKDHRPTSPKITGK